MKTKQLFVALLLAMSFTGVLSAQNDDLRIFGYFQNNYSHITTTDVDFFGTKTPGWNTHSFIMQQLNIFAAKNFGTELSSFVNLEFTNSFSLTDSVGNFKVEEAWLKYSPSSAFSFKGGLLIPRFNNFNEIKNRTVLLPYIYRPMVYETVFKQQFNIEDFVPLQAYLQAYGDITLAEDFRMNYAAFMGNSASENLNKNSAGLATANDMNKSKLFGARLGFEYGNLALGGSVSYDKKNYTQLWKEYMMTMDLGYVPRIRLGAYLNYSYAGFEIEGEYIKVSHKVTDAAQAVIDGNPMLLPEFTLDKSWAHVNLLYNFTDQLYAYAGYDYMKTYDNFFSMTGLDEYTFGAGYKVTDAIVVKGQYVNQKSNLFGIIPVTRQDYLLGASVYF